MRIYLRTRGRVRDYQFVGLAPEESWWQSYDRVTDLELPVVLVEAGAGHWRAYVSSIPSGRQDRLGRVIVLDLVLVGEQAARDDGGRDDGDRELALAIIAASLGDGDGDDDGANGASGSGRSGRLPPDRLDAVLTEEVVEEWLAEPTLAAWQDAAAAIRDVFGDVPVPSAAGSAAADATAPAGDWLGGLGSARSRAAFLALIRRLLSGVVGRALTLSYIADPGDVGDLRALIGVGKTGERELGVLAVGQGPLFRADPTDLVR